MAAQTGVSRPAVWNDFSEEHKGYPYKLQMKLALPDENELNSLDIAEKSWEMKLDSSNVFFFSINAFFAVSGSVSKKNCPVRRTERPIEVNEARQHSWPVVVCSAVSDHELNRPYFFKTKV